MPPAPDPDCLFCGIVSGRIPSFTVWGDAHHVAFLTPFPNTPGFTVVATRAHCPSYVFELAEAEYLGLCRAAKTVGLLLDRALGTRRTAIVGEGMGIDHAHLKLVPLHGLPAGPWAPVVSPTLDYSELYRGYVTSMEGPRAADEALREVANRIIAARERADGLTAG